MTAPTARATAITAAETVRDTAVDAAGKDRDTAWGAWVDASVRFDLAVNAAVAAYLRRLAEINTEHPAAGTPEDCTTTAATSRHLSIDLDRQAWPWSAGRTGRTLCGHSAYDGQAAAANRGRPVVLADLKPCGSCARSATRLAREADGGR